MHGNNTFLLLNVKATVDSRLLTAIQDRAEASAQRANDGKLVLRAVNHVTEIQACVTIAGATGTGSAWVVQNVTWPEPPIPGQTQAVNTAGEPMLVAPKSSCGAGGVPVVPVVANGALDLLVPPNSSGGSSRRDTSAVRKLSIGLCDRCLGWTCTGISCRICTRGKPPQARVIYVFQTVYLNFFQSLGPGRMHNMREAGTDSKLTDREISH